MRALTLIALLAGAAASPGPARAAAPAPAPARRGESRVQPRRDMKRELSKLKAGAESAALSAQERVKAQVDALRARKDRADRELTAAGRRLEVELGRAVDGLEKSLRIRPANPAASEPRAGK